MKKKIRRSEDKKMRRLNNRRSEDKKIRKIGNERSDTLLPSNLHTFYFYHLLLFLDFSN